MANRGGRGACHQKKDRDGSTAFRGALGGSLAASISHKIDCLALSDRIEEAEEVFENVMEYASPLGRFAEEIDPNTGEHRGNFPQAFSHVGLINIALHLNRAKADETEEPLGGPPGTVKTSRPFR